MIKINKYTAIFPILLKLLIAVSSFCLHSCIDENFSGETPGKKEEAMVRLTLTTPRTSLPKAASRSSVNPEYAVTDIKILIFSQKGDDYVFSYMVNGQQITPNGERTNFTALLKSSDEPIKLLLVANSDETFASYTPAFNTSEETIRKQLITGFAGEDPKVLPMFGEKILPSLDAKEINTIEVTMLRAIARVDVEIDLDMSKSRNFVLESVHIYRANDLVQVTPDDQTIQKATTILKATVPSVPATATYTLPYKKTVSGAETIIEKLYLPEAKACNDPVTDYGEVTCIVVGGYYNNENTPTYYRADFNSNGPDHLFGQVLRNHRYHFKIKAVNAAGWETPDEAADNRATNIIMDIQEWEDFTTEMYVDGEKYLGVNSRELIFGYEEGLKKTIGVESSVSYQVSWVGQDDTTISPGDNNVISNEFFSVQIVDQPINIDKKISYLLVTTLKENNKTNNPSENSYHSELKVTWGHWTFTIDITQLHSSHYVKDPSRLRSVRVLSAHYGGTGQLGTAYEAANAIGMRGLLDNPDYFSPSGTVEYISGFSFTRAARAMFMLADPASNNATYRQYAIQVKAEIYSADIIYLNNDNSIGPYASQVVLEWLDASPNRVLIVGTDNANTSNSLLQANGLLKDEVDFFYNAGAGTSYQTSVIGYGTRRFTIINDSRDDERSEFYDGPFGKVNDGAGLWCEDGYFGFTRSYDENKVLPLLYHNNASGFTSFSIGVNKKRGIIYFGDASMWEVTAFNKTDFDPPGTTARTGIISTNGHRFWANMWAWMTHRVIWNDEDLIDTK